MPALISFLSCAPKSVRPLSHLLYHSGVESPTHEIRADAAPSAHSAKSIIITLAKKHTFDRPVEILLHPSGTVSHVGFLCPSGRCLSQCKSWGMWEMGEGRKGSETCPQGNCIYLAEPNSTAWETLNP